MGKLVHDLMNKEAKALRRDETGAVHPFYGYRVPSTKEEITRLAGLINGTRLAKKKNVEFFTDEQNLIPILSKERKYFGGKDSIPAMEHALFGMSQLQAFLFSECETQSTPASNRAGKTRARIQKMTSIAAGFDPLRPGYEFPFDVSATPLVQWSCVPAKNVRQELMDLQRQIPKGIGFKLYTSKGDERIEFEPNDKRPFGSITRVKSYSMPVDQFQREAVHVIAMDEKCKQYIWDECRMRLLSTGGWMILAMALYDLELWLYEKNKKFDVEYRGQKTGAFGWYSWRQVNCPWLDQARVAAEAEGMSEDAKAARVDGEPRLLMGSAYFKPVELVGDLWRELSKNPLYELRFQFNGEAEYRPWTEIKRGWRMWQQPVAGATYAIGADVAEGFGDDHDSSAAHILRVDTNEIVGVFESNEIEADDFGAELFLAGKHFNFAVVAIENNIERAATHLWLRREGYPRIYRTRSFTGKLDDTLDNLGWHTDGRSKEWALEELRKALKAARDKKRGQVLLYDSSTYGQISDFGYLRETRRRAHGLGALSGHDDLVMSLAITLQAAMQAEKPKDLNPIQVIRDEVELRISKIFERQKKDQRKTDPPLIRMS